MKPTAETMAFRARLRRLREAHERLVDEHGENTVTMAERVARATGRPLVAWLAEPRAELRRAHESLTGKSRP